MAQLKVVSVGDHRWDLLPVHNQKIVAQLKQLIADYGQLITSAVHNQKIVAQLKREVLELVGHLGHACPQSKDCGPIEALSPRRPASPPGRCPQSKDCGPIEAVDSQGIKHSTTRLSTTESRGPLLFICHPTLLISNLKNIKSSQSIGIPCATL